MNDEMERKVEERTRDEKSNNKSGMLIGNQMKHESQENGQDDDDTEDEKIGTRHLRKRGFQEHKAETTNNGEKIEKEGGNIFAPESKFFKYSELAKQLSSR